MSALVPRGHMKRPCCRCWEPALTRYPPAMRRRVAGGTETGQEATVAAADIRGPARAPVPGGLSGTHRPLRELVAEDIRGLIVSGQLAAGDRLVESELAERLGVSRNPVREAIRLLEATGLVEVAPRKGAHVTAMDPMQMRHIQELRCAIEGFAAARAAQRRKPEHVAALDQCLEQGLAATLAGDNVRAAESHRRFHIIMEAASGNPYISVAVEPLRARTEMVFSVLLDRRGSATWDDHRRLRDAIVSGDSDLAQRVMVEHIAQAMADY